MGLDMISGCVERARLQAVGRFRLVRLVAEQIAGAGSATGSGGDVSPSGEPDDGALAPVVDINSRHSPASEPRESAPSAAVTAELPIVDYDALAASQVVERLTTLSDDDLALIAEYESAHRRRRTILGRIEQLRAD